MDDSPRNNPSKGLPPRLKRADLKPEQRVRLGRVAAILLAWGLLATTLLGILALWHLIRRGRLLRANQPAPRAVSLPEIDEKPEIDRLS